jgi:D-psicose/D-tagatose/L-ribulose 3-epimerase
MVIFLYHGGINSHTGERMKVQFGVNTLVWVLPFAEKDIHLVEKVGKFGFDVIELTPDDEFRRLKPDVLREELEKAGLAVTVSSSFSVADDISSTDGGVRQRGIVKMRDVVDWTTAIGGKLICGPLYSELGKKRPLSREERNAERGRTAESLKVIGEYAAKKEAVIAIEPLNRFETDMINIAEQAFEMCEKVDSPAVKMMLDTFHMNIEEKSIGTAIKSSKKHLVHMHTCANDRGTPGSGHVPWDEVVGALRDIDYEGYGIIESFDEGEVGAQTMIWRPLAPSLDSIAKDGLDFLRRNFT